MEFEHELVLAFWFAVHNENNEIARHILNMNIYIRQLVTLALFKVNLFISLLIEKRKVGK